MATNAAYLLGSATSDQGLNPDPDISTARWKRRPVTNGKYYLELRFVKELVQGNISNKVLLLVCGFRLNVLSVWVESH